MSLIHSKHDLKTSEGLIKWNKLACQQHYEPCSKEVWVRSKSRNIHGSMFAQKIANNISNHIIKGPAPGSGNT